MSNYASYFKEVRDWETLEYDWGFAIYEVCEDCVFIHHSFVDLKNRDKGTGKQLMFEVSKIAKEYNKSMLKCVVDLNAKNHNQNLLRYLHNGAKIWSVEHPFIYIYLTLEDIEKNYKYKELK